MISVLFPVYNASESVEELHRKLVHVLSAFGEPYEIIAIDDGSTDDTRQKLSGLSPITVVMLSRHFGYNAALDAGFRIAIGDSILTIDTDPNNYPEDLPLLIAKLQEGYGVAVGRRKFHYTSFRRKVLSSFANWLIRSFTGVNLHDFSCPLKGYRREFIDGVQPMGETLIFMPVFAHDRGAKVVEVDFVHQIKREAVSRYRLRDRFFLFFDLVSVKFLLSYFARPLRFFGSWACLFFLLTFGTFAAALTLKIRWAIPLTNTPLPLMGVMLGIVGVLIFLLGFITEILLRIYYTNRDTAHYMIYEIRKNK